MPSKLRIALVKWQDEDGIALSIFNELERLGYQPVYFMFDESIPTGVDVVFLFAPYGRIYPIVRQAAAIPAAQRPLVLFWHNQNPPDPHLPWPVLYGLAAMRAWVDRLNEEKGWKRSLLKIPPLNFINRKLIRFRYVGTTYYVFKKGWIDLYFEYSQYFTQLHNRHGLPAIYAPWGTSPLWHADLGLERDIDVLWMGKRRSPRRSRLLRKIEQELTRRGLNMYVADDVERPFIFGEERTRILNRAKITLNLNHYWFDNNFPSRFHVAAGNRSLVVSETLFSPNSREYIPGFHYVSTPTEKLIDTLLYYLDHEEERERIAENAYHFATAEMTFNKSVAGIMAEVEKKLQGLESKSG